MRSCMYSSACVHACKNCYMRACINAGKQRIILFQSNLTWRTLYINKLAIMPPAHQQRCSLLSVVIFASTVDVIALLPLRCIIGLMEQADSDAPNQNRDAASTPLYYTMEQQQRLLPADDMLLSPCSLPTRAPSGLLNGRISAIQSRSAPRGNRQCSTIFVRRSPNNHLPRSSHFGARQPFLTCRHMQDATEAACFPGLSSATGALLQYTLTAVGEEWAGAPPCPHYARVCQHGML